MPITAGLAIDAASGALLVALGLFVATRRPRRIVNVTFAVFSASWGAIMVVGNLVRPVTSGVVVPVTAMVLLAIGAALHLALRFPQPATTRRTPQALGSAAMAACVLATFVALPGGTVPGQAILPASFPAWIVALVGAFTGTLTFALIMFTDGGLRAAAHGDDTLLGQYAVLTVALAMDPGIRAGLEAVTLSSFGLVLLVVLVAVAGAWLVTMARATGRARRVARRVALSMLALPLVGMTAAVLLGGALAASDSGLFGVARATAVAVLAYAILQHQLLGIDVKVKWTLKQSTVAAIFIAVFFVVSEGAAAVFEGQTGSTWAGILAAGALVFAIAPLQRFAERVSDKAMPGVRPVEEIGEDERRTVYLEQARMAWLDGNVDRQERELLDRTAARLGLGDDEVRELDRQAMEDEQA